MTQREKSRNLVQIALLSAMLAVFSQLALPMPGQMPLTLQTFGVALCMGLGGKPKGRPAILIWLALGAVGVPVFSQFRGGLAVLLGPTGGFLIGFLLLSFCLSKGSENGRIASVLWGASGLFLCHLCGFLHYAAVTGLGIWESFLLVSLPYLGKDALSLLAAVPAASAIRKALLAANISL